MTKKNIIFLSVSLVLIILLGIGVSYSMWNITASQDTSNTAYTECFDLSISNQENSINLENAYPISNDKGKKLTPFTFTVTNTCDITAQYSVNLEVLKDSTLSSKFIDVMFDNNINLLSSYDSADKANSSSIESRKLTTEILKSKESKDYSLRLWIDYDTTLEDLNNEIKTFKSKIVVVGKPINYDGDIVFNFDYTGNAQTFTVPVNGTYRVELWGASGGNITINNVNYQGGLGGYVSGIINLQKDKSLNVYVGGSTSNYEGGYNGGSKGGAVTDGKYTGGGGSTDLRISSGAYDDFNSLKSRIIVAAGGAGTGWYFQNSIFGGSGGGLIGYSGQISSCDINYIHSIALGGNQNSGGYGRGGIGTFGNTTRYDASHGTDYGTGGGSGYYGGGGGSSSDCNVSSGAGGSSFISGHNGCDAIKEESTESNIIHTGQSIHYSGLYFTNTLMIDGDGYRWTTKKEEQIGMPSHSDNSIIMGNSGNGYARITLVSIDE